MHTHWRVSGQSFYLFTLSAHGGRTKSMRPPEEQWLKLLDMSDEIRAFIAANAAQLKAKD